MHVCACTGCTGRCADTPGWATLDSATACSEAAKALGLNDIVTDTTPPTPSDHSHSSRAPWGCFYSKVAYRGNRLWVNTEKDMRTNGADGEAGYYPLCKRNATTTAITTTLGEFRIGTATLQRPHARRSSSSAGAVPTSLPCPPSPPSLLIH